MRNQWLPLWLSFFLLFQYPSSAKHHPSCPPSSCGKILNITYPFRLKGDPRGCGLSRYELDCVNKVTVLTMFSGKYHVQEINYKKYQIRLTDAGIVEDACSVPRYFLYPGNFSYFKIPYYSTPDALTFRDMWPVDEISYPSIAFLNCSNAVTNDPRYVEMDTHRCDSGGHIYAILILDYFDFSLKDVKVGCHLQVSTFADLMKPIKKWNGDSFEVDFVENVNGASADDIRKWLNSGFWLSWLTPVICREQCGKDVRCVLNETTQVQCDPHRYCHYVTTTSTSCGILPRIHEYIL